LAPARRNGKSVSRELAGFGFRIIAAVSGIVRPAAYPALPAKSSARLVIAVRALMSPAVQTLRFTRRCRQAMSGGSRVTRRGPVAGWDWLGSTVQFPARRAAERDEAAVAALAGGTWPTVKALADLALGWSQVRIWPGCEATEGPGPGVAAARLPWSGLPAAVTSGAAGRADRCQGRAAASVDLLGAPAASTPAMCGARVLPRRTTPGCWMTHISTSAR
jgi:hypothetical protein